ncbi:MAG: SBBP repeat-containing protein [Bryobacterales bacterium]|nr:SBBP repeat-containing protein [Bryobacterales bacterium]
MRSTLLEHRATLLLVALLGLCLFSGQNGGCRYPVIQSAELCCDCDSLAFCPAGVTSTSPGVAAAPGAGAPGARHLEATAGQVDAQYDFVARAGAMSVFLDAGEAWLDLRTAAGAPAGVIHASLAGAARQPEAVAEEPRAGRVNYFVGNDASRWVRDVPTFGRVRYRGVYPGIDLVYYGTDAGRLEHDFVVAPGADPRLIKMRFAGVDAVEVDAAGDALLRVGAETVSWKKPVLYQSIAGLRRKVEGRYRVESRGELGFEVGVYDPDRPLIIDPVVLYSTYLGRGGNETATRLAADSNGNVYFAGVSTENSFPTTPGTGSLTPPLGRGNIVLTKMNANATELVFSTIMGGAGIDLAFGIAVDPQGSIYLTGATSSEDFPTTLNTVQRFYGKPTREHANVPALGDCFVTRLNSSGNAISFSTYLGGTGLESCSSIALDTAGNIYVAGATNSANFPASETAFQRTYRGGSDSAPMLKNADAFITKLNANGTQMLYSTFIGGNGEEAATALAVDAEGNAYITGATTSTFGFPLSADAPQRRFSGSGGNGRVGMGDAFLVKIDKAGEKLIYGTYLGGARDDVAFGLAVDKQGAAYITGNTLSADFPTTEVARQSVYRGSAVTSNWYAGDAFAAKLNPAGTAWDYATYLGGSSDDRGAAIAVNDDGTAWILGHTSSNDFWITSDATQRLYGGSREELVQTGDLFLSRLSANGQTLLFSTYMGGQGNDWALGLATDSRGGVYIAGGTSSLDFPTTPGVLQRAYGTAQSLFLPMGDVFLAKFGEPSPNLPQVSVAGVVNAASYDGSALSAGQIVVISGTEIGPEQLTVAAPTASGFPTTVGNTRVLVASAGGSAQIAAPILYASARQTSVVLPWSLSGNSAELTVEYQGVRSRALTIPLAASSPGLFSANASGRGQAAALNQDATLNSAANAAEPGSVVVLYGTGEGRTTPASTDGALATTPLPRPELPVNVTIGGQRAEVLYAGAAPGLISGVIQLNVRVPIAIAQGDQPVVVRIGDRASQTGLTVAVR